MRTRSTLACTMLLAAIALSPRPAPGAEIAGMTTAATTMALGTPVAAPTRVLVAGVDVFRYERLETNDGGRLHLLFADRTALTLGPRSEVVLDEFVYDPVADTGAIVLGAARGVMRFVGGRLSKQGAATIVTPVAVIGIRGSAALISVDPATGATTVYHLNGEVTVHAKDVPEQRQRLLRSGSGVHVATSRTPPSAPFRVDPEDLGQLLNQLEGPAGAALAPTQLGDLAPAAGPPVVQAMAAGPATTGDTAEQAPAISEPVVLVGGEAQNTAAQQRAEEAVRAQVATDATPSPPTPPAAAPAPGPTPTSPPVATPAPEPAPPPVATPAPEPAPPPVATPAPEPAPPPVATPAPEPAPPPPPVATPAPTPPPPPVATPAPEPTPPPPPPSAPPVLSGRWLATETGTFRFGWLGDGNERNDRPFTEAQIADGWLVVALTSNDQLRVPLPTDLVDGFGFDGTDSPFGPVRGVGFTAPAGAAFVYQLDEIFPGEGQLLFGGVKVAADVDLGAMAAYDLRPDHVLGHDLPFTLPEKGGSVAHASVSPLYRTPASSTAEAKLGIAAIGVDGVGSNQRVSLSGATLAITPTSQGPLAARGGYRVYALTDAAAFAVQSAGPLGSIPDGDGNHLFGGDAVAVFVLDGVDHAGSPDFARPMVVRQRQSDGSTTETVYNVKQPAVPMALPAGVGTARTDAALAGYVAATAERDGGLVALWGTADAPPASVRTDAATSRVAASFTLTAAGGAPASAYTVTFGGLTAADHDRSAFVDDARWVALEASSGTTSDGLAFTQTMAVATAIPGGDALCVCAYLQWGWWAGQAQGDDGPILVPAGTFVVGQPLPDIDLPTSGTGTYRGHAIANIVNDGARYLAAGSFENAFDFAKRTGAVTITGLDGRNYAADVGPTSLAGRHYATAGAVAQDAGRTLALEGSFFRTPTDLAGATAGQFRVTDTNYEGVGTFAATR